MYMVVLTRSSGNDIGKGWWCLVRVGCSGCMTAVFGEVVAAGFGLEGWGRGRRWFWSGVGFLAVAFIKFPSFF